MTDHWTPNPLVTGPFPHPFQSAAGDADICAVCGLNRADPDPTRCEHPEDVPCGCPRAHTPPTAAYATGLHGPGGPGL